MSDMLGSIITLLILAMFLFPVTMVGGFLVALLSKSFTGAALVMLFLAFINGVWLSFIYPDQGAPDGDIPLGLLVFWLFTTFVCAVLGGLLRWCVRGRVDCSDADESDPQDITNPASPLNLLNLPH
jgi:hypothetical protein